MTDPGAASTSAPAAPMSYVDETVRDVVEATFSRQHNRALGEVTLAQSPARLLHGLDPRGRFLCHGHDLVLVARRAVDEHQPVLVADLLHAGGRADPTRLRVRSALA